MVHERIVIAGEVWSPNLGDRIIADTLSFLLKKLDPSLEIKKIDISGREPGDNLMEVELKGIKKFISGHELLRVIRNITKYIRLNIFKRKEWIDKISAADLVIVGGGQLLSGKNLFFPLKIWMVSQIADFQGKDLCFVSCGVGKDWSPFTKYILGKSLALSSRVSVRDSYSRDLLRTYLPGLSVALSSDPALWAKEVYGFDSEPGMRTIGLGIINIRNLNNYRADKVSEEDLIEFWMGLGVQLINHGYTVELFTNGSQRDYCLAEKIYSLMNTGTGSSFFLAPRPTSAKELAETISGYSTTVASRLHAHIISTAYQIPSVALVCDPKVETFFRETGREDLLFYNFDDKTRSRVVEEIEELKGKRLNESHFLEKKYLILSDVENVLSAKRKT
jgi:polysaccharide pyruvyl transferase WcaK-like protein